MGGLWVCSEAPAGLGAGRGRSTPSPTPALWPWSPGALRTAPPFGVLSHLFQVHHLSPLRLDQNDCGVGSRGVGGGPVGRERRTLNGEVRWKFKHVFENLEQDPEERARRAVVVASGGSESGLRGPGHLPPLC